MKKSLLILFFTCWALFFAAFRPVMPFAAETAAFPDGTPVTGGRILMGTIGEPSNLIPYMASDSASGEITGLLLEPAYRGRRLGEQLIGCAVRQLRAEGAKRLVVQLPPEHPARGFFRYFGFAEQGSDRLERSIKVPKFK